MAKNRNETEITKVGGVEATAFLANFAEEDKSLDTMQQYRIVPRFKVIQPTSDKALKDKFGEGTALVRPGDTVAWKDGDEAFEFVPLFFWTEFCKWADLRDKENHMIMETSYDPTSPIAKKSKGAETRTEVYEGQEGKPVSDQWKYRYVEHLRFVGIIYGDHPLSGVQVALSFERGEFFQGTSLITAITMRKHTIDGKKVNVPLWAQVWELSVGYREKGDNRKWYGFDFEAAKRSNIIADTDAEEFLTLHKELAELHSKNLLKVDDEATEEPITDSKDF